MRIQFYLITAVFFSALAAQTSLARADVQSATFHSDHRSHHFTYRTDLVAIRADRFSEEAQLIEGLTGIVAVPAAAFNGETSEILGIPVEFSSGVRAVVSKKILVRATSRQDLDTAASTLYPAAEVKVLSVLDGVYSLICEDPVQAIAMANTLISKPGIVYAHPDFYLPIESRSSPETEPMFGDQWNLEKANIRPAWQITTGSRDVIVAVIDLGFEQNHPDLTDAWYVNEKEIPGNRLDDDGNGLKDDVSGWNYAINSNNLIYGQNPAHGTASSGVIGARANGKGVTGICTECRILPIVIDSEVETAVAAFYYARSFGAQVISNSWGYKIGTPRMDAVVDAINQTARNGRDGKGTSVVFAMSNFGRNDCRGPEPDISSLDAVIAVSSVDNADRKIDTSAFGPCMEFVAPTSATVANAVPTTDRPGEKGYNRGDNPDDFTDLDYTRTFYGTSAATPQVAGILALLFSAQRDLNASEALTALKNGADKVHPDQARYNSDGYSELYGFGRINAGRSLTLLPIR